MPKLRPVSYDEFAKKLKRAGYVPVRKSKHVIYVHLAKHITIPLPHKHPHDIPKGLIHKLIKEMSISLEDFNRL